MVAKWFQLIGGLIAVGGGVAVIAGLMNEEYSWFLPGVVTFAVGFALLLIGRFADWWGG